MRHRPAYQLAAAAVLAGLAAVALVLWPLALAPVLVLGTAIAAAGAPRFAGVLTVALVLCAAAGLRVERSDPPASTRLAPHHHAHHDRPRRPRGS